MQDCNSCKSHLWLQEVQNPVLHALERDAPEEEDDEDDVGEDRRDVDDLWVLRDALDHAEVDEHPGGDEAAGDGPVERRFARHARTGP